MKIVFSRRKFLNGSMAAGSAVALTALSYRRVLGANERIDVAERTKRIVQVGTQQRSGLHYQRARELIRGGHIGCLTSVRMVSNRNIGAGFGRPADMDAPNDLDWDLWLGPAPMHRYNPLR